ncbi:MAG: tRNA-guanine transglycosylase, partial [Proteobacteria bacterium]|nr:tRNA-guanine transglycosylase [Pseudomonadota bacterium]
LPTSMAQQGKAFTSIGRRDLRRGIYKDLEGPLDPACHCYTCKTYSLAYLYHLSRVHESQAWQLIGIHNIHFYMKLTRTMREHILNDTWLPFYNEQRLILDARDSYGPKSARYAKVDRAKSKLQLGRFEVVLDEDSARIRDLDSGNFIHGDLTHGEKGPAAEAGGLFVSASRILEKLTTPAADTSGLGPLILWDVGLGSAALAMKLVRAIEQAPPESLTRKLVMVSFEESNKLDALRLVLKYSARFKHAHHPGPARLHKHGQWKNQSGSITWNLMIGSFGQEIVGAPSPDVIFFNPSVFQADSEHWNLETLRALSKNRGARGLDIFTFTASDSVRGAFTEAGFRLATLIGANHQAEITIASIAPL